MAENLKSNPVTNYDATPGVQMTAGEGATGWPCVQTDSVNPTASVTQWSTYRLARFPTNSKVKRVWLYVSGLDTNGTATATLDTNIAFSDDTPDGPPAALQGTIPSNKRDGTSLGFVADTGYSTAYANSGTGNKLFGNTIVTVAGGATQMTDITFKNTTAAQGFFPVNRDDDLWNIYGFTNATGQAQDPGGAFDMFVVVAAAVATAAVGVIGIEIDYVV